MSRRLLPALLTTLATALVPASAGAATTYSFTEYPVPAGADVRGLAAGPDGALWFAEYRRSALGRMATDGTYTEFPVPASPDGGGNPAPDGVAAGPDGALWFTEYTGDAVSRMTTSGQVTRYTLPGFASRNGGGKEPEDIAAGPDGNLWFLESSDATVGRVTPSGAISEFPIPGGGIPTRIAPGPDGQMWITSFGTGAVYRMSTSGQVTATYNLPTEFSGPRGIVAGADGAIWVVEGPRGKLARITTDGQITELEGGAGEMASIVVGPDHALYATGPDGGGVDAINRTDGGPIERATAPAGTVDAVLGSDGALWMTQSGPDKLLRVLPSTPTPPPPTRCVVPKVLGLKLAAAKTRLVKAHCRLGKVKRPRRAAAGRLRVTRQSPRAGTTKPAGTKVALTLGLRR